MSGQNTTTLASRDLIYIVHDQVEATHNLTVLFECEGYATRSFSDLDTFVKATIQEPPKAIVIAALVNAHNCLSALRRISAATGDVPYCCVLLGAPSTPFEVHAKQLGASDVLVAPVDSFRLLEGVNKGVFASTSPQPVGLASLSARERAVLEFIVSGHTLEAAATQMQVSRRSAEVYEARGMAKLGLSDLGHAARLFSDKNN